MYAKKICKCKGLRIINKSIYSNKDLRKFFIAGLNKVGAGHDRVILVHNSRSICHGLADCPGKGIELWLPRPDRLDIRELAYVFEHEVLHNLGVEHKDMSTVLSSCGTKDDDVLAIPNWAKNLTIRIQNRSKH